MSLENLPPGFRFHPTDEELVNFYLAQKVAKREIAGNFIPELDLYKCEPWDISDKCTKTGAAPEWYFFSPRDKKYPNGGRTNRATEKGYWKATGKDRAIHNGKNGPQTGMKKTLVFYQGRAPKGIRTDWIMHEYRLEAKNEAVHTNQDAFVLCRVFNKKGDAKDKSPAKGVAVTHHSLTAESPKEYDYPTEFPTKIEPQEDNGFFFPSEEGNREGPSFTWSPKQGAQMGDFGDWASHKQTTLCAPSGLGENSSEFSSEETFMDTNSSRAGTSTDHSQVPPAVELDQYEYPSQVFEKSWKSSMDSAESMMRFLEELTNDKIYEDEPMRGETETLDLGQAEGQEEAEDWREWISGDVDPAKDAKSDNAQVDNFDWLGINGNGDPAAEVMNTADVAEGLFVRKAVADDDCFIINDTSGWCGDDAVKAAGRDDDGQVNTPSGPSTSSGIKIHPRLSHRNARAVDRVDGSQHKIRMAVKSQSQAGSRSEWINEKSRAMYADSAASGSCVVSPCMVEVNPASLLRKVRREARRQKTFLARLARGGHGLL